MARTGIFVFCLVTSLMFGLCLRAMPAEYRPQADTTGAVLPFQYSPPIRPFLTVQARFRDSEPLTFVVDTGSGLSLVLTPEIKKRLGLTATGEALSIEPDHIPGEVCTGGKIDFLVRHGSLKMTIDLPKVVVADLPLMRNYLGSSVAGIVGGDFFTHFASRFDFNNTTLTFFSADHVFEKPLPGTTVAPLIYTAGGALKGVELPTPDGHSTLFNLDTGSDAILLPQALADKYPQMGSIAANYAHIKESSKADYVMLGEFHAGTLASVFVPINRIAKNATSTLGMNFLDRFVFTLVPGQKQVIFEPRRSIPIHYRGDVGFTIHTADNKTLIEAITRDTVKKSGIDKEDELISIDDIDVTGLPYHQTVNLMDGNAGTSMRLKVRKPDGRLLEARLFRFSPFANVICIASGLILGEQDKKIKVLYVQPQSESTQVGIKAGYELVAIAGVPVKNTTLSQIETQIGLHGDKQMALTFTLDAESKLLNIK